MSKIEELKETLRHRESLIVAAQDSAKMSEAMAADLRKQIAALEAEAAGPQQWTMYLSWNGQLFPTYGNCPSGRTDKITVIEKKPMAITKAMAVKMSRQTTNGRVDIPAFWVLAFNAIGIDAVEADE